MTVSVKEPKVRETTKEEQRRKEKVMGDYLDHAQGEETDKKKKLRKKHPEYKEDFDNIDEVCKENGTLDQIKELWKDGELD